MTGGKLYRLLAVSIFVFLAATGSASDMGRTAQKSKIAPAAAAKKIHKPMRSQLVEKGKRLFLVLSRQAETVEIFSGNHRLQKYAKGSRFDVTKAAKKANGGTLRIVCRDAAGKAFRKTLSLTPFKAVLSPAAQGASGKSSKKAYVSIEKIFLRKGIVHVGKIHKPMRSQLVEKGKRLFLVLSRQAETVEVFSGNHRLQKYAKGSRFDVTKAAKKANGGTLRIVCRDAAGKAFRKTLSLTPFKAVLSPAAQGASGKSSKKAYVSIEKIFLRKGIVHVGLKRKGGKDLTSQEYAQGSLSLKLDLVKRSWRLTQIDPKRMLNRGEAVIFNTGIKLTSNTLVRGSIAHISGSSLKSARLSPPAPLKPRKTVRKVEPSGQRPVAVSRAAQKTKVAKPLSTTTNMIRAKKVQVQPSAPAATPKILDRGIRIARPATGQIFSPGDGMYVIFYMSRELGEGEIEFLLVRQSTGQLAYAVKRFPYRPIEGEWGNTFGWELPTHGLPAGSDYYIHASQSSSGAWGTSDTFSIQPQGGGTIHIAQPSAGSTQYLGSEMKIYYRFQQRVGEGLIHFDLYKLGPSGNPGSPLLGITQQHHPAPEGGPEPVHIKHWRLPEDIVPGDRFFIVANHPQASGQSDLFSIERSPVLEVSGHHGPPPEAITILAPTAGDHLFQDTETRIRWTMPDPMSAFVCGDRVDVRAIRLADGHETLLLMDHPTVPGENATPWTVYKAGFEPGGYKIRVTSNMGCNKESGRFEISEPPQCDYGLESVTFSDGRSLERGLALGAGPTVEGTFRVRVRWNGVTVPPEYPPGTAFHYRISVSSANTGANLSRPGSGVFDYTTRESFDVDLRFSFEKDSIPSLSRDRFIPLKFELEKIGISIDGDSNNNTLDTSMRVLNARENDMELDMESDFWLGRTPHAGPLDEYRLCVDLKVRNRSRNEAGGPPAPIDVPIRYCMQSIDPGMSWGDYCAEGSGTFIEEHVGEAEHPLGYCHVFWERSPDDIPAGRQFRFVMEIDPHRDLVDPNRGNNRDSVTFRIVD